MWVCFMVVHNALAFFDAQKVKNNGNLKNVKKKEQPLYYFLLFCIDMVELTLI